jgi:hypothetical protein
MKFTLPISPEYVPSWGLWEAVREIYQNALDEQTHDPECKATIEYIGSSIVVSTSKGKLSTNTLVLGKTSKREDPSQRGKFGEGYKLALLVLRRLGHGVIVANGDEVWIPKLEFDDAWQSNVLNIYVEQATMTSQGVAFLIHDVSAEDWQTIQRNIRPVSEFYSTILEDASERGRIYVGGLYVSTAKEFQCGYAFRAGQIKLDRDRGMIDGFDLAWETSNLWTERGSKRVAELLEAESPDVRYVESHATKSSPAVTYYGTHFTAKHGRDAIPVSSQEEIERATNAGMKWVLVPEKVKSLYRMVKSWFIPTTASPLELLVKFRKDHEWRMDANMKQDLEEIIHALSPKEEKQAVAV